MKAQINSQNELLFKEGGIVRTLIRPRIQKGSGYRGGVKPEGEITILKGI